MENYLSRLVEVDARLADAVGDLREQLRLLPDIDDPRSRPALRLLLSNGLWAFCWLEDQRNALAEMLGQCLPLGRR
jgi:hypothetical protein